jgi:hypothetical protein
MNYTEARLLASMVGFLRSPVQAAKEFCFKCICCWLSRGLSRQCGSLTALGEITKVSIIVYTDVVSDREGLGKEVVLLRI